MDFYLGEIRIWTSPKLPDGWAWCDGSSLQINNNQALFSLIGTTWGGDGISTFNLPDLRGRLPIGQGNGTGLTPRTIGQQSGNESITLTSANIPAHTHAFTAMTTPATATTPSNTTTLGAGIGKDVWYVVPPTGTKPNRSVLSPEAIGQTGGNQSHPNMMPGLALNFIISLTGLYPQRAS